MLSTMAMSNLENSLSSFDQLIKTVHRLREPGGCPWDRAQTHQSLRQYLIEEAYEVVDILDEIHSPEDLKNEKTRLNFQEELGDVLMQVVLHSEMTSEVNAFSVFDVAQALNDKLIRRHPHVLVTKRQSLKTLLYRPGKNKRRKKKLSVTPEQAS
jgi:uncharacterized protein YabN with tetrapyrrole methylase and pyrophosphatase domain